MKINKILMGLGAVAALSLGACSNDEPANTGNNPGDAEFGDQYLTVSVMMPNDLGGRADDVYEDTGNFDKGIPAESQVDNMLLFFFDGNDNVIDVQLFDKPTFNENEEYAPGAYVSHICTKSVRLKAGLTDKYKKVAVVLNTKATDINQLLKEVKNKADFLARVDDYAINVKKDGSFQPMSNSVFFNTNDRKTKPEGDPYTLVDIDEAKHVYTSASELNNGKVPVEIYVERISAKVTVKLGEKWGENYKVSETNDGKAVSTITVYNSVANTTTTYKVKPQVLGITLNVLTDKASLIKNITADPFGNGNYGSATNKSYEAFLWNDPLNMRCYWAETPALVGMEYFKYTEVVGKNIIDGKLGFTTYINPNTQEYQPGKEENSLNTKLMIVAKLVGVEVDAEGKEIAGSETTLDMVRFGGEYMLQEHALQHTANLLNVAVRSIDWNAQEGFDDTQKLILTTLVNNSFVDGIDYKMLNINAKHTDTESKFDTYFATIDFAEPGEYGYELVENGEFGDYNDDDVQSYFVKDQDGNNEKLTALFNQAKVIINKVIDDTLAELNNKTNIIYWKDGQTYYYTTIKQQGFVGLTGEGDNYLNGVVRNHIYDVTLDSFFGLGTPVIDPEAPIDPERPDEEMPSYIQAKINILPWRVVKNNATLH